MNASIKQFAQGLEIYAKVGKLEDFANKVTFFNQFRLTLTLI
jgi:hypothetical protein